jgi:hypothetical protein
VGVDELAYLFQGDGLDRFPLHGGDALVECD